jgi:serine-type D-Ala-D-Ala carboxypeptidase/endopeptidase (penicillin-binding protein 4)
MRAVTVLALAALGLGAQPDTATRTVAPLPAAAPVAALQAASEQSAPGGGSADSDESVVTAPTAVHGNAAFANLQTDLAGMIRRPGWRGDRWSVLVVSLDHGDTLYAQGAYDRLAPASNMKLFTTAAALYYLGPDFRWNTFLMATGPLRDGVLEGDLVLYGTGDPTFSARFGSSQAVWTAFADTLEARGVRHIRGDIVGDGSYFEGSGVGEGWQHSYMNAAYAASAGALSYADNVATLQISPASQAGWRPTVKLVPGGEGIAVVNQATTVGSGTTRIQAARVAYDGPIVIRGQIARGSAPLTRSVPVSDPERFAAAIFREVLERRGIAISGTLRSAQTAQESPVTGRSVFAPALDSREPVRVLAVHTSPPVIQVLDIINKRSHNLMSEQVLRTIGRVATGEGSVLGGRRAIEHMMRTEGHPAPGEIEIYDGSGLSILNRSSARGIVSLLAVMAESPMWNHYWETLPEAGTSVGLRRMHRTAAEGNLRAKTGTIDRVSALSGYVRSADGERLAFSIISNNVPSTWMAKRVEDAIGARLADFDRSSPGQTVARAPAASRPTASPQSGSGRTHTIRRGDTLDGIARQYGTSVAALQRANPGLNPRRLIPGRSVRIP